MVRRLSPGRWYNRHVPILGPDTLEFFSRSPEQTRRVAMRLGERLQPGDLVALTGDLGAGKTTFVQGLTAGWGSTDPVTSPTFVLVNLYRRPDGHQLAHLDAYRLQGAADAWTLDLDALLAQGPLVVEWADRIETALPADGLWVHLEHIDAEQRGLRFQARGPRARAHLQALRRILYGGP